MEIIIKEENSKSIALVQSDEVIIYDVGSALDFIATINYQHACHHIIINKEAIQEDFFNLSTCLAGDILQKFINYQVKLAIVGDFSGYTSKSLRDFIYESNQGKHIFFMTGQAEALEKLSLS